MDQMAEVASVNRPFAWFRKKANNPEVNLEEPKLEVNFEEECYENIDFANEAISTRFRPTTMDCEQRICSREDKPQHNSLKVTTVERNDQFSEVIDEESFISSTISLFSCDSIRGAALQSSMSSSKHFPLEQLSIRPVEKGVISRNSNDDRKKTEKEAKPQGAMESIGSVHVEEQTPKNIYTALEGKTQWISKKVITGTWIGNGLVVRRSLSGRRFGFFERVTGEKLEVRQNKSITRILYLRRGDFEIEFVIQSDGQIKAIVLGQSISTHRNREGVGAISNKRSKFQELLVTYGTQSDIVQLLAPQYDHYCIFTSNSTRRFDIQKQKRSSCIIVSSTKTGSRLKLVFKDSHEQMKALASKMDAEDGERLAKGQKSAHSVSPLTRNLKTKHDNMSSFDTEFRTSEAKTLRKDHISKTDTDTKTKLDNTLSNQTYESKRSKDESKARGYDNDEIVSIKEPKGILKANSISMPAKTHAPAFSILESEEELKQTVQFVNGSWSCGTLQALAKYGGLAYGIQEDSSNETVEVLHTSQGSIVLYYFDYEAEDGYRFVILLTGEIKVMTSLGKYLSETRDEHGQRALPYEVADIKGVVVLSYESPNAARFLAFLPANYQLTTTKSGRRRFDLGLLDLETGEPSSSITIENKDNGNLILFIFPIVNSTTRRYYKRASVVFEETTRQRGTEAHRSQKSPSSTSEKQMENLKDSCNTNDTQISRDVLGQDSLNRACKSVKFRPDQLKHSQKSQIQSLSGKSKHSKAKNSKNLLSGHVKHEDQANTSLSSKNQCITNNIKGILKVDNSKAIDFESKLRETRRGYSSKLLNVRFSPNIEIQQLSNQFRDIQGSEDETKEELWEAASNPLLDFSLLVNKTLTESGEPTHRLGFLRKLEEAYPKELIELQSPTPYISSSDLGAEIHRKSQKMIRKSRFESDLPMMIITSLLSNSGVSLSKEKD
ncbi:hypothetical protein PUMCH_000759 [Australozyma saopauloensis]|uniref:Uncharacterized protein n=1 Tax=Australozyma saopauloensis TaxID=291208 RepID=A0AAX4H4W0_9ASCO|nr:hypothetical protein PUMCH_000759 [[Candida] saopauloensis]